MKTVIFDLDGTLANTCGDMLDATNACIAAMGLAPQLSYGVDDALALRGARAMLRESFTRLGHFSDEADLAAEIEVQFPNFVSHYTAQLDKHSVLYDGVVDAVTGLRAAGFKVGVCTNKPGAQAEELLTRLGVRHLFASLIAADTLPVRKPHPQPLFEAVRRAGGDPTQAMLIGDTVTDRDTARNAGMACVLVTFSPLGHSVADLQPDALLHDYKDLRGIVESLLG